MTALDDLQAVIFEWKNEDSMIQPTLQEADNCYRLQLVELTEDNSYHTNKLDKCIDWVSTQLLDWPDCRRIAWDMWNFKHRRDAEKFITLFHLSWAQ